MNFRSVLVFAVIGLLLVSSLDAAKAKGGKGKKGTKEAKPAEKAKVEKRSVNEEVVKEEPVKEKPAKAQKPKAEKAPEPVEEAAEEAPVVAEAPTAKIVRPKNLKVFSAYDKCKLECAKIRENQDLNAYVVQLRDELAAAETAIAAQVAADEAAHAASAHDENAPAA